MKKVVKGFLLMLLLGCLSSKQIVEKKEKDLKDYKEMQSDYQKVANLIKLSANDTICDIGGGMGVSSSILSIYLPISTIFYEEDIDKKSCTKNQFNKVFKYFKSPANIDNFRFKIGTETNIPYDAKSFNNVTVFISLHEFSNKELMLKEISRILRDTGNLYLFENVYKDTLVKDKNCGFNYLKETELYRLIDEANFKIIKDTTFGKEPETENSYTKFLICTKK